MAQAVAASERLNSGSGAAVKDLSSGESGNTSKCPSTLMQALQINSHSMHFDCIHTAI